ncbi:MAG: DUF488 domain-containing protein [Rhodocyclaceae bacterium]|nr:DUF488 domain-containing protein [Rhodocyclaceae bacterium]
MIFTIGYSTRSLAEFLHELQQRNITHLWDVRSSPWSRNHAFNANQIERWAERAGIFYRLYGDVLGGQSELSLGDPRYLEALVQLVDTGAKETVAIMCAEGRPEDCHRTTVIAASLFARYGVIAQSICRDGSTEMATESLRRAKVAQIPPELRTMLGDQKDLFGGN